MNASVHNTIPAFGAEIEGGFFHGAYVLGGQLWGEVTAPKADGEVTGLAWLSEHIEIPANHDFDGLHNTVAMGDAGSPLAQAVRALRIGGFDDWYIPARGGLFLQWANLAKPGLLAQADAFDARWYWSSTQRGRDDAWLQGFGGGYSDYGDKSWEGGRARAVRRFLIG